MLHSQRLSIYLKQQEYYIDKCYVDSQKCLVLFSSLSLMLLFYKLVNVSRTRQFSVILFKQHHAG